MTAAPEFAADVCSTLEAAVDAVQNTGTARHDRPTRNQVEYVATGLKQEVAKVGLMFSQSSGPGEDAAPSLLADLRDSATALCMIWASAAAFSGPTLRQILYKAAKSISESVSALVKAACQETHTAATATAVVQLAGVCIDRCEAAIKVPLDNRTAIGRALGSVARQLADGALEMGAAAVGDNDFDDEDVEEEAGGITLHQTLLIARIIRSIPTVEEFERLVEQWAGPKISILGRCSTETIGGDTEGVHGREKESRFVAKIVTADASLLPQGGEVVLLGSDLDGMCIEAECEAISSTEGIAAASAVLWGAQTMMQCSGEVLKAAMRALLSAPIELGEDSEIWESIHFHALQLSRSADDLCAAAYPQHDDKELCGSVESMVISCELIVDEVPRGTLGEGTGVESVAWAGRQLSKLLDIV